MHLKFFASLRESPFIEGMGRILDFAGIINSETIPVKSDTEALNDDWGKVMGDYKHTFSLPKENGNGGKTKQKQ